MDPASQRYLPRAQLTTLIDLLQREGYRLHGPQVRDGAIVYAELAGVEQLPQGLRDEQAPGHYRLQKTGSLRQFAWANGPQALKPLLFPPQEVVWLVHQDEDGGLQFEAPLLEVNKVAVLGVRACDLAALELQDRHFLRGAVPHPGYAARRQALLLIAVNCSHPAATCFCASTGDGPVAELGFDLCLDELDEGFLIASGSERGAALLAQLALPPAAATQRAQAEAQRCQAARQSRRLDTAALHQQLQSRRAHPQWDDVAARCLACGNCTQVCPSCFCHAELDRPSLTGEQSSHERQWDSCFSAGHGYLAGHQVRPDTRSRYQQWMIHKLDSWHGQYGRSGCVGCGRCTTWCPAEIDFVAEARRISEEAP